MFASHERPAGSVLSQVNYRLWTSHIVRGGQRCSTYRNKNVGRALEVGRLTGEFVSEDQFPSRQALPPTGAWQDKASL